MACTRSGFLSARTHPQRMFGTLKGSAPGASFVDRGRGRDSKGLVFKVLG